MIVLNIGIAAVSGYLVGSISSGRLIWKIVAPQKPIPKQTAFRLEGSDDELVTDLTSATTVSHHLGARYGFITFVLDVLKVFLSALAVKYALTEHPYYLITAITGVIGHIWPVYYGFKGGRGISPIFGGVFLLDWIAVFATSLGGMIFGLLLMRDMLVAYMAGVWFLIPWMWFRTHDLYYVLYAVAINVVFNIAMIPEIKKWIRITREGKWSETANVMQLTGMGRGILKMAKRLGIYKQR
jgi:acyl-phosphate glycerol 3-phosphate acyltransferase